MRSISFLLVALFAFFLGTLASPIPEDSNGLEKRVTHTGRGTWYNPGLGNCGDVDHDWDAVVAISKKRYDSNGGANCNQWMKITNTANGKSVYAKTRDSCQSCTTEDVDMSPSVFQKIAPLSTGVLKVKWNFMNKSWKP